MVGGLQRKFFSVVDIRMLPAQPQPAPAGPPAAVMPSSPVQASNTVARQNKSHLNITQFPEPALTAAVLVAGTAVTAFQSRSSAVGIQPTSPAIELTWPESARPGSSRAGWCGRGRPARAPAGGSPDHTVITLRNMSNI